MLFAASLSATGHARGLIRQAMRGKVALVTSPLALEEARRNLATKASEALSAYQQFLDVISLELVQPTKNGVLRAVKYTPLKDAPIIAAAKKADVDYLVTFDRKHLLEKPEVAQRSGLEIVTPEAVIAALGGAPLE